MRHPTSSATTIGGMNNYSDETEVRRLEDTLAMSDWHSVWDTAPNDPLPSNVNHLVLLDKPANIDLSSHAQKSMKVILVHYDATLVPEGRAQQDLRWKQELAERYLKQDAEDLALAMERKEARQHVVRAAQHAEVIDLTDDEIVDKRVIWTLSLNVATQQHGATRSEMRDLYEMTLVEEMHRKFMFPSSSTQNKSLGTTFWRASAHSPSPYEIHTAATLGTPTNCSR